MKWIKSESQKPHSTEKVLFMDEAGEVYIGYLLVVKIINALVTYEQEEIIPITPETTIIKTKGKRITYWMPLPEAPHED
jgi:hypothetical protein